MEQINLKLEMKIHVYKDYFRVPESRKPSKALIYYYEPVVMVPPIEPIAISEVADIFKTVEPSIISFYNQIPEEIIDKDRYVLIGHGEFVALYEQHKKLYNKHKKKQSSGRRSKNLLDMLRRSFQ